MITLRPKQEEAVAHALESGVYKNVDEFIDRALELLLAEDEWLLENKRTVDEKIERATRQPDAGQGIPY